MLSFKSSSFKNKRKSFLLGFEDQPKWLFTYLFENDVVVIVFRILFIRVHDQFELLGLDDVLGLFITFIQTLDQLLVAVERGQSKLAIPRLVFWLEMRN